MMIQRIALCAALLACSAAAGQTPARPGTMENRATRNPACQRIVSECRNAGFIQGQWKRDNGLWRDCFDPVVKGGTPTQDGRPVNLPVSPNDVEACRAALQRRR